MMNPAGYMNMEYATLEMSGAHRSFRHTISADSVDQLNYNTYFDYFGFGFKFSDWIAGSFSLSPLRQKDILSVLLTPQMILVITNTAP